MISGAALLVLLLVGGCGDPDVLTGPARHAVRQNQDEKLFEYAADSLNRLPEFGPQQILGQIVERLNQWVVSEDPQLKLWQPDPLTATLPVIVRQGGLIDELKSTRFAGADGQFLREAVWLRDIASAVCARPLDEHEQAARWFPPRAAGAVDREPAAAALDDRIKVARLFDWTVRNLQLEPDAPPEKQPPLRPWQALLLGRGTATERAWVFMLLARQQRLDVVLLATRGGQAASQPGRWLPAHLDHGQLYLYDMHLGLPVPGPQGRGVATLAEAAADDAILRQLDVAARPYPFRAADLREVVALVEADRGYLARRMKLIETRLTRDRKMILSVAAAPLAERLRRCRHVTGVQIWPWPYYQVAILPRIVKSPGFEKLLNQLVSFQMPVRETRVHHSQDEEEARRGAEDQIAVRERTYYPLWSGRLRHFQGCFDKLAAPADEAAFDAAGAAKEPKADDGQTAKSLYLEARTALDSIQGADVPPAQLRAVKDMRENATYWLGLIAFEQRQYDGAADWFRRTIETWPQGQWVGGAKYNLARAYEAAGKRQQAIGFYEDPEVSMPAGCTLRAGRLKASVTPR